MKRKRSRRPLLIALPIVIVLAAAGIIIAIVVNHGASGLDRFALPQTVDGMPLTHTTQAATIEKLMSQEMSGSGAGAPVLGAYQDPNDATKVVVLEGLPYAVSGDPSGQVDQFLTGEQGMLGADLGPQTSYDPGSMGGQMECAGGSITNAATGELDVSACVVVDSGGIMAVLGTSYDEAQLAQLTQSVRPTFEKQ